MSRKTNADAGGNIRKFNKNGVNTNIDFEIRSPWIIRILLLCFAVLLISYGVYQTARLRKSALPDVKTKNAQIVTISKSVNTEAYILRQETPVLYEGSGTVVPAVPNGEKVFIGETVANAYQNVASAEDSVRLAQLQNRLQYLQELAEMQTEDAQLSLEIFDQQILKQLLHMQDLLDANEYAEASTAAEGLSGEIMKKRIATGSDLDVNAEIERLQTELAAARSGAAASTHLKADASGFFISALDGFERIGDYGDVRNITVGQVEELLSVKPAAEERAIGKLVTEFCWYLVCCIDEKDAAELETGGTVKVTFAEYIAEPIEMKIAALNKDGGGRVAMVLYSTLMNAETAVLRRESVKICLKEYTGIPVDQKLVRTKDNKVGVYVLLGNTVAFSRLDIIYTDGSIVLSAADAGADYLHVDNEIILEGDA